MFRRLLDKINRFMFGRYGADQLYYALIILYVIFFALSSFFGGIFTILALTVFILSTCRYLSKNIYKRREENRKFLAIWQKVKNYFSFVKDRYKDRKVCRYRKCKYCGAIVRLPIKKGKHSVNCPKCKRSFKVHIPF